MVYMTALAGKRAELISSKRKLKDGKDRVYFVNENKVCRERVVCCII